MFNVDNWVYGKNKKYQTELSEPTNKSIAIISGITENNGTNYYTEDELNDDEIFESELTISTRGEYSGTVFYHQEKFALANNILVMLMPNLTKNQKIFLGSLINKFPYGGYSGYPKKDTLKFNKIKLPLKKGKINFDFMERFVAKLENLKIEKLEEHLSAKELNNYELTEIEKITLANYDNIEWGEFKLGKLFERIKTNKLSYKAKDLPNQSIGNHILPCLTSSFNNQGLNYYAPKDGATILKNVISIPSNSDVYRAYFQSNEFTVLSDAYAIQWILDDFKLLPNQYLFAVQCINKVTDLPIYSYKNKLGGWNVVKEKHIQLPIKNGKPDYELMGNLTSAIKKLVIKDVVLYVERKKKELNKLTENANA